MGTLLKALLSYNVRPTLPGNGNPSLLEVSAYVAYLVLVGVASLRQGRTMVQATKVSA